MELKGIGILIKSLLDIEWFHYAHASMQTSKIRTLCVLSIESLQRHLGDR